MYDSQNPGAQQKRTVQHAMAASNSHRHTRHRTKISADYSQENHTALHTTMLSPSVTTHRSGISLRGGASPRPVLPERTAWFTEFPRWEDACLRLVTGHRAVLYDE